MADNLKCPACKEELVWRLQPADLVDFEIEGYDPGEKPEDNHYTLGGPVETASKYNEVDSLWCRTCEKEYPAYGEEDEPTTMPEYDGSPVPMDALKTYSVVAKATHEFDVEAASLEEAEKKVEEAGYDPLTAAIEEK